MKRYIILLSFLLMMVSQILYSDNAMEISLKWFMYIYHQVISPQNGKQCRFIPTCSRFAEISINRFGIIKGSIVFADRFLRCNPIGNSGYDPVPIYFVPTSNAAILI